MENNAIIIRANGQFKSKELNTATNRLAKCYENINKNKKDACVVLWHVENTKAYKEDGFNSLAEYAEAIGIDKSTAHKMADAGMIWDNKNPVIAEKAQSMDYTTVSQLASLEKKDNKGNLKQGVDLAEAIANGELDNCKTVADVKAWKDRAVADAMPKTEKIAPVYQMSGHGYRLDNEDYGFFSIDAEVAINDPKEYAYEIDRTALVATVKDSQHDGTVYYLALCADGSMFNYYATKKTVKKEKLSSEAKEREMLKKLAEKYGVAISFDAADIQ